MMYLSLDIGGTKLALGVFSKGEFRPERVIQVPLQRGIKALTDTVFSLFSQVMAGLDAQSVFRCLFIGCPGVWEAGKIKSGTAVNLEAYPGEFDQLNLGELLLAGLPSGWSIHIQNDALSQALGGVRLLSLSGASPCKVCYVGPGTGLGGALFQIEGSSFFPLSSGHWADIVLPVCKLDLYFPSGHYFDTVKAEQVLSGSGVVKALGLTPLQLVEDPLFLDKYSDLLRVMGWYLHQLLRYLSHVYSPAFFIIGGSLGTRPPFSTLFLKESISDSSLAPFYFISDPVQAALIGAVCDSGQLLL